MYVVKVDNGGLTPDSFHVTERALPPATELPAAGVRNSTSAMARRASAVSRYTNLISMAVRCMLKGTCSRLGRALVGVEVCTSNDVKKHGPSTRSKVQYKQTKPLRIHTRVRASNRFSCRRELTTYVYSVMLPMHAGCKKTETFSRGLAPEKVSVFLQAACYGTSVRNTWKLRTPLILTIPRYFAT